MSNSRNNSTADGELDVNRKYRLHGAHSDRTIAESRSLPPHRVYYVTRYDANNPYVWKFIHRLLCVGEKNLNREQRVINV